MDRTAQFMPNMRSYHSRINWFPISRRLIIKLAKNLEHLERKKNPEDSVGKQCASLTIKDLKQNEIIFIRQISALHAY